MTTNNAERSAWQDVVAAAALAAGVCAFWWPLVSMRRFPALDDMGAYHLPVARIYALALAAGHLPLWTPDLGAGYPLFAEGQVGALYPPNALLFGFLPTLVAMNLSVVGHVLLATLSAYACARALGTSRSGAMLSGAAFGLSGLMVVHVGRINLLRVAAWLPLLILCVDRAASSGRPWRWALGIAFVVAMQLLAGHPQIAAFSLMGAAIYAAFAAGAPGRAAFWRRARALWPVAAAGVALGVGLGAAQVAATVWLASYSGRPALAGGYSGYGLMPLHYIISLLLPTLFGSPKPNTFAGEIWQFEEWCGYVGAIPLLLALASVRRRGPWRVWALGAMAATGLILAVSPQVAQVIGQMPLLRGMRYLSRGLLLFVMSASLLAGIGLDRARAGDGRAPRLLGWTAAGLAILGALLWLSHGRLAWVVGGFQPDRSRDLTDYAVQPELWLLVATVAGAALALWRGRQRPGTAGAAVVVLAGIELFAFGSHYQEVVPRAFYQERPWTAKALLARGQVRLYARHYLRELWWQRLLAERGDWSRDRRVVEAEREGLNYNWPAWYGLRALRVYSALPLKPYRRVGQRLALEPPAADAPLWGAMGTQAVITPGYLESRQSRARLAWVAYSPRVRVVGALRARNEKEALDILFRRLDPRRQAVVQGAEGGALPIDARGSAKITRDERVRVAVRVEAEQPGLLVLADAAAPGWRATVNGRAVPILLADGMFRAVMVPQGESQVAFEYRPTPIRLGVFVSLVAVALGCGALACLATRRGPAPLNA